MVAWHSLEYSATSRVSIKEWVTKTGVTRAAGELQLGLPKKNAYRRRRSRPDTNFVRQGAYLRFDNPSKMRAWLLDESRCLATGFIYISKSCRPGRGVLRSNNSNADVCFDTVASVSCST